MGGTSGETAFLAGIAPIGRAAGYISCKPTSSTRTEPRRGTKAPSGDQRLQLAGGITGQPAGFFRQVHFQGRFGDLQDSSFDPIANFGSEPRQNFGQMRRARSEGP